MSPRKSRKATKSTRGPSLVPLFVVLLIASVAVLAFVVGRNWDLFSPQSSTQEKEVREAVMSDRGRAGPGPSTEEPSPATEETPGPATPRTPEDWRLPPGIAVSSIPLPARSPINEADRAPEGVSGKIALTFDAGAATGGTVSILRTLKSRDLCCTFFLTGKWVERNRGLTRRIAEGGHEIANHTYSHKDLTKLSDEEITEELARAESLIKEAAGVSSKPYFRPPFGARNRHVLEVAAREGYSCVYWTVDSWDAFREDFTAEQIARRVLSRAQDGCIVLMHCGSTETALALPRIIDELGERHDLVTISELLNES